MHSSKTMLDASSKRISVLEVVIKFHIKPFGERNCAPNKWEVAFISSGIFLLNQF